MSEAEEEPDSEFDGPWKEALEWFLEPFFEWFFPAVFDLVDWSRGHEFLDKELREWELTRALYDRGLDRDRINQLFHLIDWMVTLSPPRQLVFKQTVSEFEEGRKMPFVSVLEELAMERGIKRGKIESIETIFEARFGADGLTLMPRVREIADLTELGALHRLAITGELAAIEAHLTAL